MELNLARDVKDKKKGFCKHTGNKRRTRDNVRSLLNKIGDLITQDMVNTLFPSVFTNMTSGIPDLREHGERLEQIRCTLGGRGPGQRTVKQTRHT